MLLAVHWERGFKTFRCYLFDVLFDWILAFCSVHWETGFKRLRCYLFDVLFDWISAFCSVLLRVPGCCGTHKPNLADLLVTRQRRIRTALESQHYIGRSYITLNEENQMLLAVHWETGFQSFRCYMFYVLFDWISAFCGVLLRVLGGYGTHKSNLAELLVTRRRLISIDDCITTASSD